jgi:phosphatidyl-myo-inositol dimannoside synthase
MKAASSLRVFALVGDAFGGRGGIAQYNRDFLSALAKCERIDDVTVLPRACAVPPGQLPAGVRQLPPVHGRLGYSLQALRAARALGTPDIVFCGHLFMVPLAALLAKLSKAQLWVQVHGIEAWQGLSRLHQRSLATASLVTSVSRYTRRQLLHWAAIDPALVKVLPNTVDARFRPGPKPIRLLDRYEARGQKVLITVSRLASSERYKGHDRVIRALPRILAVHPEVVYLIVGDGDDRQRLEALSAEVGVSGKTRFVGSVEQDELLDYLRLADVFVMPSTGEGFGIVFLEAMATGLRAIGGNLDGSLDALCNSALATAIEPENHEELIAAISAALNAPTTNGQRNDRFNFNMFGSQVDRLVNGMLAANRT